MEGEIDISQLITQLGMAGLLIYLFLKEMFSFLKSREEKRRNNGTSTTAEMFKLLHNIEDLSRDLHNWHDAKDEDQVFVWYVRKSLERHIEKLANAVEKMSEAAGKQTALIEDALGAILDELKGLRQAGG